MIRGFADKIVLAVACFALLAATMTMVGKVIVELSTQNQLDRSPAWGIAKGNEDLLDAFYALSHAQTTGLEEDFAAAKLAVDILWSRVHSSVTSVETESIHGDPRFETMMARTQSVLDRLDPFLVDSDSLQEPDALALVQEMGELRPLYTDVMRDVVIAMTDKSDLNRVREKLEDISVIGALGVLTAIMLVATLVGQVMEQRNLVRQLKRERRRIEQFAEVSKDWFWETDTEHRISFLSHSPHANRFALENGWIGRNREDFTTEDTTGPNWQMYYDCIAHRKPFQDFVYQVEGPDGESPRRLRVSGVPIFDDRGEFQGYRGTGSDVTVLLEMEETIRNTQKMQALGQLAGGIAHDFNNLLAVFIGRLEMLSDAVEDSTVLRPHIDRLFETVRRGKGITDRLLTFTQSSAARVQTVDIAAQVFAFEDSLRRLLGQEIDLDVEMPDGLLKGRFDPVEFDNALLNLAVNAKDAMPEGGTLTVAVRRYDPGQPGRIRHKRASGDYVEVAVKDTGVGMTPEVLRRCLDPLFTSKTNGRGTGLGLSLVSRFVETAGGSLEIDSKPHEGTHISILLPLSDASVQSVSDVIESGEIQLNGRFKVLVVEDNEQLLDFPVSVLKSAGFKVESVSSAEDAMLRFAVDGDFDAVFSDIALKGKMTGVDLFSAIRDVSAETALIATTGNLGERKHLSRLAEMQIDVLPKPFSSECLKAVMMKTLKQKGRI